MKTHFADDATLAHIARLERDRAELIEALRTILDDDMSDCRKSLADEARALLSRIGVDK